MRTLKPHMQRFSPLTSALVICFGGTVIFPVLSFQQHGWSIVDSPAMLLMLMTSWSCIAGLFIHDKRSRSIVMTEEGIWHLDVRIPNRNGNWSIWERRMLKWEDVQHIEIGWNFIVVRGHKHRISINTYIFKQPSEVLSFVKESLKNTCSV
ncbi:MAG: hypothetical protein R8K20_03010 [Gallionellaceae bacterium]